MNLGFGCGLLRYGLVGFGLMWFVEFVSRAWINHSPRAREDSRYQ